MQPVRLSLVAKNSTNTRLASRGECGVRGVVVGGDGALACGQQRGDQLAYLGCPVFMTAGLGCGPVTRADLLCTVLN
jgi:hypothetical protein